MKKCTTCLKELDESNYYKDSRGDFLRSACKDCYSAERKQRYKSDPSFREDSKRRSVEHRKKMRNDPLWLANFRDKHLQRVYGISGAEYDRMFLSQGSCCVLCKRDDPGKRGVWHLDHCHKTKRVRGILCCNCNNYLGAYETLRNKIGFVNVESYLSGTKKEDSNAS